MVEYSKRYIEEVVLEPMEIKVKEGRFEDAVRKFKIMVQVDGILQLHRLKSRYEKPSEKNARKRRETESRKFLADLRESQIKSGEFDKRLAKKEKKKEAKMAAKRKAQTTATEQNNDS